MPTYIGIIPNFDASKKLYTISAANIRAIEDAGGLPYIMPYIKNSQAITYMMSLIDGLYLTGGGDIDPDLFGEAPHRKLRAYDRQRDIFEVQCIHLAYKQKKPIFAVCRGMQILNIAFGGSVYQDLSLSHITEAIQHEQIINLAYPSHHIIVKANSLLSAIIGEEKIKVNSMHHQAVHHLGENLMIAALATDGIIEAIEGTGKHFILGVQWHPEQSSTINDASSIQLYRKFLQACEEERIDENH